MITLLLSIFYFPYFLSSTETAVKAAVRRYFYTICTLYYNFELYYLRLIKTAETNWNYCWITPAIYIFVFFLFVFCLLPSLFISMLSVSLCLLCIPYIFSLSFLLFFFSERQSLDLVFFLIIYKFVYNSRFKEKVLSPCIPPD